MTIKEKLKYMLNVPEDYSTKEIANFLSYYFNIEDDVEDIEKQLEKEER